MNIMIELGNKCVYLVFVIYATTILDFVQGSCDGCGIIIDTDIGGDDAMAIALLIQKQKLEGPNQYGSLLAITTVTGNTGASYAARNAKVLLGTLNFTVPIIQGGEVGLSTANEPSFYYGYDGFGDFLPTAKFYKLETYIRAATFIAETVRKNPGKITLLFIGPLTNLALALHINPLLVEQIKHIFILGGDYKGVGDVSGHPGVEANMLSDPDAASFFFSIYSSSDKVTLVPNEAVLTITYPMNFRKEKLGKIGGNLMELLNKGEKIGIENDGDIWVAYDQSTSALLLDSTVASSSTPAQVFVITEGPRGAMFAYLKTNNSNVNLITKFNKPIFTGLLFKYLKS